MCWHPLCALPADELIRLFGKRVSWYSCGVNKILLTDTSHLAYLAYGLFRLEWCLYWLYNDILSQLLSIFCRVFELLFDEFLILYHVILVCPYVNGC